LHGDVLMWLMKTLLTSGCTNQRGAGHLRYLRVHFCEKLILIRHSVVLFGVFLSLSARFTKINNQ
ncbi:hypothetical protein, partial [Klebsiella pneumoniae]|uniref:hypothetical protein n=1 Tax=Klebsiella pneumoniae TaxID=573 RepID=UPI001C4F8A96